VKLSDFDFDLPESAIAQQPSLRRDRSRLMVPGNSGRPAVHLRFDQLPDLLAPGDLLVLNDTRVLKARLFGTRSTGGRVELLLLEEDEPGSGEWWCMMKVRRSPRPGEKLRLDGEIDAELLRRQGDRWLLRLEHLSGNLIQAIDAAGHMPLPPYIRREPGDPETSGLDHERYQTVFARCNGAVAAPTAGLHFTPELLGSLHGRGVGVAFLTLHVGAGTFLPVRVDDLEDHVMHTETYTLPRETVEAISAARKAGGRIVAVGTTVVRTLEGCTGPEGDLVPGSGRCNLFIRPGYRFRNVDAMITNFHLPCSTLLMLVSAFAGREVMLRTYAEAVRECYRFFSYGDAMLIE
jgi:S-adenosylmethionine:tRNA ribosyltransferase-isomerase